MSKIIGKFEINDELCWNLCIMFCVAAIVLMLPNFVYAQATSETTITTVLCNIVAVLTGQVGKGIATIAVVFLGIGLFLGKISWGVAVSTAIGIAGIFGAQAIVGWLGGAGAGTACTAG